MGRFWTPLWTKYLMLQLINFILEQVKVQDKSANCLHGRWSKSSVLPEQYCQQRMHSRTALSVGHPHFVAPMTYHSITRVVCIKLDHSWTSCGNRWSDEGEVQCECKHIKQDGGGVKWTCFCQSCSAGCRGVHASNTCLLVVLLAPDGGQGRSKRSTFPSRNDSRKFCELTGRVHIRRSSKHHLQRLLTVFMSLSHRTEDKRAENTAWVLHELHNVSSFNSKMSFSSETCTDCRQTGGHVAFQLLIFRSGTKTKEPLNSGHAQVSGLRQTPPPDATAAGTRRFYVCVTGEKPCMSACTHSSLVRAGTRKRADNWCHYWGGGSVR